MDTFILALVRRGRPREGWALLLLALAALLCVQQAAASAAMALPATTVGWLGLLGLLLGRRLITERALQLPRLRGRWLVAVRWLLVGLVWLVGVGLGALAVGRALPPPALVLRDLVALLNPVAGTALRWDSLAFLGESLPRFWGELLAAPYAGDRGALLIVGLASVLLTWSGGLALGLGLRRRGGLLSWALPLLTALAVTLLLGGGAMGWLFAGFSVLLLLVLLGNIARRQRVWQEKHFDYPGDLRLDALVWGGLVLVIVLPLSAALPFALDNPFSRWLWERVQTPSGLEAIERNIEAGQQPRGSSESARVAGSTLPEVPLGQSLEQGPPSAVSLRVRVREPFVAGPWPHYWRSRVLPIYTGDGWRANAILYSETPILVQGEPPSGLIAQEFEDLRLKRSLLYGLPDVVSVSVPANAERMADGTLTAYTIAAPTGRYSVYSRPQELALPPQIEGRPDQGPDLEPFLALPRNLPLRVADLARTLTRDSATRMEAALAIERYLRELPYSYQVAALRSDGDAVDQFLFEMRQGYCTYYASAFAVLARTLGIPARVSIGYTTGSYDAATQSYVVYERDAHAWPELYLDGRWLAFEPTPVVALPARSAEQPADSPATVEDEAMPAVALFDQVRTYIPGLVALAGLLAAIALPFLPRLLRPDHSPLGIQRQLERRGARLGVVWPPGATLHEYGALLQARLPGEAESLASVIALLEEARYRGQPLDAAERQQLRAAWERARQRIAKDEGRKTKDERATGQWGNGGNGGDA